MTISNADNFVAFLVEKPAALCCTEKTVWADPADQSGRRKGEGCGNGGNVHSFFAEKELEHPLAAGYLRLEKELLVTPSA